MRRFTARMARTWRAHPFASRSACSTSAVQEDAAAPPIRLGLRQMLEQVAGEIGIGAGHCRLECEFRDGHLAWWTTIHLRRSPKLLPDYREAARELARDLHARAAGDP
jgi:hypothetical protein